MIDQADRALLEAAWDMQHLAENAACVHRIAVQSVDAMDRANAVIARMNEVTLVDAAEVGV